MKVSDDEIEDWISSAVGQTPANYLERLQNVAFILEDEPSEEQRLRFGIGPTELLFGVYEGTPLTKRFGMTKLLPDKITIFKKPLLAISKTKAELKENVRHTVWHEIAHYFGLEHSQIYKLDGSNREE